MYKEYIKQQVKMAREKKRLGNENANRIEEKLRTISDYLDEVFGPVSEESIRAFDERCKQNRRQNADGQKYNDK